jgi:hypothetical protein
VSGVRAFSRDYAVPGLTISGKIVPGKRQTWSCIRKPSPVVAPGPETFFVWRCSMGLDGSHCNIAEFEIIGWLWTECIFNFPTVTTFWVSALWSVLHFSTLRQRILLHCSKFSYIIMSKDIASEHIQPPGENISWNPDVLDDTPWLHATLQLVFTILVDFLRHSYPRHEISRSIALNTNVLF